MLYVFHVVLHFDCVCRLSLHFLRILLHSKRMLLRPVQCCLFELNNSKSSVYGCKQRSSVSVSHFVAFIIHNNIGRNFVTSVRYLFASVVIYLLGQSFLCQNFFLSNVCRFLQTILIRRVISLHFIVSYGKRRLQRRCHWALQLFGAARVRACLYSTLLYSLHYTALLYRSTRMTYDSTRTWWPRYLLW